MLWLSGYLGRLRRKSTLLHRSDDKYSWKRHCVFQLGPQKPWQSWVISSKNPFGVGCFICRSGKVNSQYSNLAMHPKQGSDLANHSKNKKHINALKELQAAEAQQGSPGDDLAIVSTVKHGLLSGLGVQVPRMETWVAALNGVLKRASFAAAVDDSASASVGSALLAPETDASRTVTRKLLQCLRAPLDEQDLFHMQHSVAASIGIDKGDVYLVVYGRILSKAGGLYDFLLGIDGDTSPDLEQPDSARKIVEALKRILVRASTKRGTQRRDKTYFGPDDTADNLACQTFCDSVISITAYGGPTEQRAAYECSPHVGELVGVPGREPLFPNCALITRDRAHRVRSVQKLFFKKLPPVFRRFINGLMLGKRSLCTLIEQSEKFGKAFIDKQKEFRSAAAAEGIETVTGFSQLIKSMSFADHRFDSRIRPLHRLFRLLMVVLSMLEDIASGRGPWQPEDKTFAKELLLQLSGDQGYNTIVSAALVADIMIVAAPFLRVADESNSDFALSAEAAARCIANLHHLLQQGAIWLPQAKDTLVHGVLRAIKDKLVILGSGSNCQALAIRWPAPDSSARAQPVAVAKECLACEKHFVHQVCHPHSCDGCRHLLLLALTDMGLHPRPTKPMP